MIKSFFRWQFWRWRYRAMRKRALAAEQRLEAEMWRNRAREDELITVPMRLSGLYGMPPREAPAMPIKQVRHQPLLHAAQGIDSWTWADQQEFEMFWKPPEGTDATTMRQMKERFHNEVIIPRRKPLNDEFSFQ